MESTAIQVQSLGKHFLIGEKRQPYKTVRELVTNSLRNLPRKLLVHKPGSGLDSLASIWALRDVSFEVQPGEVLGIIGRNGAGKSTLLKILSRITEPTTGEVFLYGNVGSLLEVGTGFHPELTGRENVYLNGAILGMRKQEVDRKFDEIVAFAELDQFIDTPIKHYSSGMAVRLAFAVASHLETEIILIDEVLAVGDAAFQKKCMALLSRSVMEGRTALIVSHNMGLIRSLCSRAILLEKGRIIADAPTEDVISLYFKSVVSGQDGYKADTERVHARLYVSEAYCCDAQGNRNSQVACGENLGVRLTLSSPKADTLQKAKIHLRIYSAMGEFISYVGSKMAGFEFPQIQNGDSVICEIQNLNIAPGEYYLGFIIADGNNIYDAAENALSFTVTTTDYFGTGDLPTGRHGQVLLKSRWRLE